MSSETEFRLGIEQSLIDDVSTRVSAFIEDTQMLEIAARGRLAVMKKEQPEYVQFLAMTGFEISQAINPLTYATAVVMGYEMVPKEARSERFTQDEMNASYVSVQEYITRDENDDEVLITINLQGLKGKLEKDSPDFIKWLDTFVDSLDDDKKKADVLLGFLLAVAPFYFRAEARNLAHELSQFGKDNTFEYGV